MKEEGMKSYIQRAFSEFGIFELVVVTIAFVITAIVLHPTSGPELPGSSANVIYLGTTAVILVLLNIFFVLPLGIWAFGQQE
jgi:low affinity Fe/Cu permease